MRPWQNLGVAALAVLVLIALVPVTLLSPGSASANPIGGITAVSAGEGHTCALTTAGGVKCWGDNYAGQLGNGTTRSSAIPVDVAGLTTDVLSISAGFNHTCALTAAGGVKCWGSDDYGQLGNGGAGGSAVPVDVSGLTSGVAAVDAGSWHTCVLMATGTVKCWGKNDFGQVGDGTVWYRDAPADVVGLGSDIVAVDAGFLHTCAVTAAGRVKCWGKNDFGQLGDGTAFDRLVPVEVPGLSDVVAVAGGLTYTCALTSGGGVKCWGDRFGNTPADVPGLASGVAAISSSYVHTCVLTASGSIKCWGANSLGQLGDGQACGASNCLTPVDVVGLAEGAASISAGAFHSCAVVTAGNVKCWGGNSLGELGNGISGLGTFNGTPVDVVEGEAKPTPTPTPCPPAGCPTPTPRPEPPQTGLDFSIAIDANGDGIEECSTGAGARATCSLPAGSVFLVVVSLNALPSSVRDYDGFDIQLDYAGVASKEKSIVVWPDCGWPASFHEDGSVMFGCARGIGAPSSTYVGPIGTSEFNCTGAGSVTLVHGPDGTMLHAPDIRGFPYSYSHLESEGGGEQLAINCGPLVRGDVNCNVAVNSVDAVLILQYHAELLDWLGCPQHADVNLDNTTNSIDAAVTLQFTVGLVASLPPQQAGR